MLFTFNLNDFFLDYTFFYDTLIQIKIHQLRIYMHIYIPERLNSNKTDEGRGNGATDSTSACCIIRGTVAGFESLTIIRSPKCLVDPGYIIDT